LTNKPSTFTPSSHTHDQYALKAGDTFTGIVNIKPTTSTTWIEPLKILTANQTANQNVIIKIGKTDASKNCGYLGYQWASNASDTNFLSLGHHSNDHLVKIYGDKNTFSKKIETPAITLNGTDLQTTLDGKAPSSHTHTKSQITDFAHTHSVNDLTDISAYLLAKIYPVGSVYISFNYVSPASFLGGTWQMFSGQFLLAATNPSNTGAEGDWGDRYIVDGSDKTGGETSHTLTINEMPTHHHTQYVMASIPVGNLRRDFYADTASSQLYPKCDTSDTGGDQAHNILPPYITVYMWVRTA
jgi:hypothetical protein